MAELIDLVSSSPEPAPRKHSATRVLKDKNAQETKKNKDGNGGRSGRVSDSSMRKSASGAAKASKPSSGFGDAPEEGRGGEKVKEKTEAEKIRELRLKRFGGSSSAGPGSPAAGDLSLGGVIKETSDGTRSAVKINDSQTRKGGKADHTTGKGKVEGNREMTNRISIDDSYGAIDLTLDDFDDVDDFEIPRDNDVDRDDGWNSKTFSDTGMMAGTTNDKGSDKNVDYSDPFRSSPPRGVSKDPKIQSHKSAPKSNGTGNDLDASINLDDFDFDDSYDVEVPVAKRRRVSPTPKNRAMTKETGGLRRTVSATEKSSRTFQPKASGLRRSKTMESDPVAFTSSPDPFEYKHKKAEKRKAHDSDDGFLDIDDLPSPPMGSAKSPSGGLPGRPKSKARDLDTVFSDDEDSDGDLPDPSNLAKHKPSTRKSATLSRPGNNTPASSPPRPKAGASKTALAAYEKQRLAAKKDREKAEKAVQKAAEKEAEKERKRVEKENKAKEQERKAAFAKVNKLMTDKKDSTPQMIVDLPVGLDSRLGEHTKVLLEGLKVEVGEWDAPVANVIRWRRKVDREWDDVEQRYAPVKKHIKKEKHVLVVIKAEEFLDLINGEEGKDLDCHVLKMKGKFEDDSVGGGKNIIYLIEGLTAYVKKNRNAKNRQFAQAVRNQMETTEEVGGGGGGRKRKTKANEVKDIDEDKIEDALLNLQVLYNALVYHTGALAETAQWITVFTQHISTIPWKHQKSSLPTAFCMESGQIKTGENVEDTYIKMLQENVRLTAPIAYGIASHYPSAKKLIDAFEEAESREKGSAALLLKGVRKSASKDGAFSDREIGPALSKRICKVFMGRDETSTDI